MQRDSRWRAQASCESADGPGNVQIQVSRSPDASQGKGCQYVQLEA